MLQTLTANRDALDLLFKFLTLALGVLGFCWTLASGLNSLRTHLKAKREEQIARCIASLAEENPVRRLSAVNGLTANCRQVFPELLLLCAAEKDPMIKALLADALTENCRANLTTVIAQSAFAARLYAAVPAPKGLDAARLSRIRRFYERDNAVPGTQYLQTGGEGYDEAALREQITLSGHLMSNAFSARKRRALAGHILLNINGYQSAWRRKSLSCLIFQHNNLRHARISDITFSGYDSEDNNFYDAALDTCAFSDGTEAYNIYRKARMKGCAFRDGEFTRCNFSESAQEKGVYERLKMHEVHFRGAKLRLTAMIDVTVKLGDFRGAAVEKGTFLKTSFYQTDMSAMRFTRCVLHEARFGGSELSTTTFTGCTFKDVSFAGADLRKCNFEGCKLEAVTFAGAKNTDKTFFKGCTDHAGNPFAPEKAGLSAA